MLNDGYGKSWSTAPERAANNLDRTKGRVMGMNVDKRVLMAIGGVVAVVLLIILLVYGCRSKKPAEQSKTKTTTTETVAPPTAVNVEAGTTNPETPTVDESDLDLVFRNKAGEVNIEVKLRGQDGVWAGEARNSTLNEVGEYRKKFKAIRTNDDERRERLFYDLYTHLASIGSMRSAKKTAKLIGFNQKDIDKYDPQVRKVFREKSYCKPLEQFNDFKF